MRSCFSCYVSEGKIHSKSLKKSIQEYKKAARLASFANLSTTTDKDKITYICKEIEKLGRRNVTAEIFTYKELSVATQNFNRKNLIGEGGFGRVYKGYIERKNIEVAVKQLDRNGFQGNEEFLVEVLVLSLLHHPNLVNLVGYCAQGNHRILVYEYMPNGSLEDHLLSMFEFSFDKYVDGEGLDWNTRMKIARGAARGLEYLHEQADPPVIYRDFKASNILLDKDFNPKLSDFGLAKLGPIGDGDGDGDVSTRVMGTYGYCAPEYASTGHLTTKSDVYSFGVVFLEIITGRRVVDVSKPTEEHNLLTWAAPLFKDREKFHLMADPLLNGNYPERAFHQALAVAAMCLQEEVIIRPFMSDVVTALEYLSAHKSQVEEYDDDNDDDDDVDDDDENGDSGDGDNGSDDEDDDDGDNNDDDDDNSNEAVDGNIDDHDHSYNHDHDNNDDDYDDDGGSPLEFRSGVYGV